MTAMALTDEAAHARLCDALEARRVELVCDLKALAHRRSPVFSEWDSLAPMLSLMLVSLGALLFGGLALGIAAMAAVVAVLLFGLRHWVAYRIRRRAEAAVRAAPAVFDRLWQHGGVALVLRGPQAESCLAPSGDWRRFVRHNIADAEG